jgi:hypothetical protein
MKKIILILTAVALLYACNNKPDDTPPWQPYTSFVVVQNADNTLYKLIVGYPDSAGYWHRIDTLGNMSFRQQSKEFIIDTAVTNKIYLFWRDDTRLDTVYYLTPNIKNIFGMNESLRGIIVDNSNHYEYPF